MISNFKKAPTKLQLTRPVDVLPSLLGKEVAAAGDRYEDCKFNEDNTFCNRGFKLEK
jgi:hypothetical protein